MTRSNTALQLMQMHDVTHFDGDAAALASTGVLPQRVLSLLRKSDKPGEDNCSFEVQERSINALISKGSFVHDPRPIAQGGDRLQQVVSGWQKTANRKKIAEVIEMATSGRYHAVVVYKMDRLGRRVSEVSEYLEHLADHNVLLISVVEGVFDLRDPMRMQFALFLAVQSQGESASTSQRVRNDRATRKSKGAWLGGPPPFGFEVDADLAANGERVYNRTPQGTKRLRLRATEAATLRLIVDWICVERMSTIAAVRRANEEGLRNREGKEFRYQHIRNLLRSPVLFGGIPESDYDKATGHVIERSLRPAVDDAGNPHVVHEPLMSLQEWLQLQRLTGQRATWIKSRSAHAPLLAGLIRCGAGPRGADGAKAAGGCGARMYGSGSPHAKSSYTCRVSCSNRGRCAGNTVTQVAVEEWVTAVFLELLSAPDFARQHAKLVAQALDDRDTLAATLLKQLNVLQEQLPDLEMASRTKSGRARILAIDAVEETERQVAETRAQLVALQVVPDSLHPFVGHDPAEVWRAATQGQRSAWLATVFSKIEVLPSIRGRGAQAGGFGSRGLDPRRIRIHTHHNPDNPIVVADDYQLPAPDLGGSVTCPDCDKELRNWAALAAHRRWAHGVVAAAKAARGETAKEYRCYEKGCDRVYYVEVPLRNHLYREHGITQGYPCPQCERTFALPAHLGRHLGTHRDERDACELCGKLVKHGGLRLHKVRAHGNPS
ncbi:MAG: recombinase family protein [Actinomycetales bacterium]